MELLRGLGVNQTVGIQLVIFIVTYLVLNQILFKPYFKAYTERVARTMGRAELAEKYLAESQVLQKEYETKARELSTQFKTVFDGSRAEAVKEYDEIVGQARQSAKAEFEERKKQVQMAMAQAQKDLTKEIPTLAEVITARLLGRDLGK